MNAERLCVAPGGKMEVYMRYNLKKTAAAIYSLMRERALAALLLGTTTVMMFSYFVTSKNIYVIRDGENVTIMESYNEDVRQALGDAGYFVGERDRVLYPEAGASSIGQVIIERAQQVTVNVDGETFIAMTFGETVESILHGLGVAFSVTDEVSPDPGTITKDNMEINVTRSVTKRVDVTEPVPFGTRRVEDKTLLKGTERLVTPGKNGLKTTTYEVVSRGGVERYRTPVHEVVDEEAVECVVSFGAAYADGSSVVTPEGEILKYSEMLEVSATAYTTEGRRHKRTATGTVARVGAIAVDPRVIPLGTKVYISSPDGESWVYGVATCEDTGGVIKGNIVDLFFDTRSECWNFGRRSAKVYILE